MSFAADWLALRAPADTSARAPGLEYALSAHFAGRESLRLLDLGGGTGNNMRHMAPRLPGDQTWIVADSDARLLDAARPVEGHRLETRQCDLSGGLDELIAETTPDAVLCSAFLDLCGADLLSAMAEAVAGARLPLLAVLTYDGRQDWAPAHGADAAILDAFNGHMRQDKGLGVALGPDAAQALAGMLAGHGHDVRLSGSDWVLERARDGALMDELSSGTAEAVATVMDPKIAADWGAARRQATGARIGHLDLLALPPG